MINALQKDIERNVVETNNLQHHNKPLMLHFAKMQLKLAPTLHRFCHFGHTIMPPYIRNYVIYMRDTWWWPDTQI